MITFKGRWGKLYYTLHTLLSNVGQLPFLFFLRNKHTHTHTRERKRGFNTGTSQLHSKAMITFKGGWGKLYYTQHTLLSNVG